MSDKRTFKDLYDEQTSDQAKKRLFIGLTVGTGMLLNLLLLSFWVIPYIGLSSIHPAAPWLVGLLVLCGILLVFWASFGLVYNITTGRSLPLFKRMRGTTVNLFLPLMILLGHVLGIPKNRIRSSFIKVNNELVLSKRRAFPPQELLLLMPHCLQNSRCGIRLTYDVNKCKRCGKCPITGLLALSERYGIQLAIATGGTIARRIVVQKRPKLIMAVACERDLTSGIQDTYPLPVFGILNQRPQGPCLNTQLPMEQLEQAIKLFLQPQYHPVQSGPEHLPLASPALQESPAEPGYRPLPHPTVPRAQANSS